jgi:hypothetical protein
MDQKLDMYLKNTNTNRYPGSPHGDKHKKDLFVIFKNLRFEQLNKERQTILL